MRLVIENFEKCLAPSFIQNRMLCLWQNRRRLHEVYKEYSVILLATCDTVVCDLDQYFDQYVLKIDDDYSNEFICEVEVLPEKVAVENDLEYIKSYSKDAEHELSQYVVGSVYSNYFYLGDSKEEGKLYFRVM